MNDRPFMNIRGIRFFYPHAILALGILTFCTTVMGIVLNYSPIPWWDQWDGVVDFYMRLHSTPLKALFEQHNEHRPFLSRLIFLIDIHYFGGRNLFVLAANVLLAGLIALLMYRIVARHLKTVPGACLGAAGAILVCVFSWAQYENFTWGFQTQWFMVFLLALCAFHAQEISKEFGDAGNMKKSYLWQAAAVASAALATLSMANGVLVSLMLVVQAAYLRFAPGRICLLILCAALIWGGYFADWFVPGGSNAPADTLGKNYINLPVYILLYLGSPIHHAGFGKWATAGFGALVLAGIACSVFIAFRREKRPRAVSLLAMSLFLAGGALITASGRLALGVDQAMSSRYATAALLLLCSVSFFLWINAPGTALRRWIGLGTLFAVLAVALCQRSAFAPEHEWQYRKLLAGLALRSHVYDDEYIGILYPFPVRLRDVASRAEAMRISIFAPDQPDYETLPSHVSAEKRCLGAIEKITPTTTANMLAARGWAFDPATHEYIRVVVFTDADGTVLGSGLTGDPRLDLRDETGSEDPFGGWIGFFRKPPTQSIRVFGKLGEEKGMTDYCLLESVIVP